ncbi:IS5/IS1182 family transposase [Nostoc sphaeroides CCNUC1]|uniref:IS5/IS1182 family transposase n=1 Tax=Nostoc sphaeroides CCNUC1 TaxID=2653204 RepID=A0A5P8WFL2_9NOSO|nr:IS5/IS1182 family transposase [Nostoc sphaeroides CCNUC1]
MHFCQEGAGKGDKSSLETAQKKKKPGRRAKLTIEDQVLMVIQYWREYRTYYHIGLDWGLSESAVCRTVYKIENILISSRKWFFR